MFFHLKINIAFHSTEALHYSKYSLQYFTSNIWYETSNTFNEADFLEDWL